MRILRLTPLVVLLLFVFQQNSLSAQDKLNIKFGKVKPADFDVQSPLIDSNTNAVVVADVGKSSFVANTNDLTFSLVYTQKKRIKIINKNGFDAATITIPLYISSSNVSEKLEHLEAYTYNIENGKVVENKVEKSAVFTEKHNKNWIYKKFTFPMLKEGSIIEYSYEVKSDFFFNLQSWTFQGQYPVLWSQYEATIPEFFKYVILSQGYHPFFIKKTDRSQTSFSFRERVEREGGGLRQVGSGVNNFNVEGSTEHHTWVMKDVPALKEEAFTTTLDNAVAKTEFQLNQIAYPNSLPKDIMGNWEKVANELMTDDDFGNSIGKPNNWLDDDAKTIVKTASTQKEKAEKIFEFVRDKFTCNDKAGIYMTSGLRDVFKNKTGSVADINMLLIALLKNQKIGATPVILSTREHGFTHEFYPLLNRYNYVIAKIVVDSTEFYLDATNRKLPFGQLPSQVYNGHAREIYQNFAAPVSFVADSLQEASRTFVFVSNTEKGGIEGSYKHELGTYGSLKFRNHMAKISQDDFGKSLRQQYSDDTEIDNINIDSLKLLDQPVGVKFDLKFKAFADEDIVYFNPMLAEATKKNPFVAAKRYYPVEMPYTVDELYTFSMEIPKGYKVDEIPKSVKLALNEDEGMFEYLITADKEYIQMRRRLVLKKANFANEDYDTLRQFYTFIVKKEAEQIVFKKIK